MAAIIGMLFAFGWRKKDPKIGTCDFPGSFVCTFGNPRAVLAEKPASRRSTTPEDVHIFESAPQNLQKDDIHLEECGQERGMRSRTNESTRGVDTSSMMNTLGVGRRLVTTTK